MRHPRALALLNFVSMWECFSYYGMRVLLVLFMVHEMRMSDHAALGLYALYITLIELGGLAGGMIADRFLGLKPSIVIGGLTIALGHLCLAQISFFGGLGLIVAGTALFRSNAAALLGAFYEGENPLREAGYTLYYTGINIGGFLASLLCGFVGEMYGWHAGFGLAAVGMMSGNIALFCGWKLLAGKGEPHKAHSIAGIAGICLGAPLIALALYYHEITAPFVPCLALGAIAYAIAKTRGCSQGEKKKLGRLALCLAGLIVFFACEEQLGSSLVLFAERYVDRGLVPAASLIMFNPLTILITGPLLSKIPLSRMVKIGISFLLLGMAFCLLYLGCILYDGGLVPLSYAICSIVLIALGEIFIGPTVYAYAAEVAPKGLQGLTMGMVTLGFALANLCSGTLSQWMTAVTFTTGFGVIGASIAILSLSIFIINRRYQYDPH